MIVLFILDHVPALDPVDELTNKVKVLETAFQTKKKPEAQPKKDKKMKGITSKESSKTKGEPDFHEILDIPIETLTEILKQK